MSAEHYEGARELVIKDEILREFNEGVEAVKSTILSHGFSKKAVDDLQMTLREFAMHIGDEEAQSGAYHYFADGKPFYEMRISTPGSLLELAENETGSPAMMSDKKQGLTLFFEI